MPQVSRMIVVFCACFSQAAFPPLCADIDSCETARAATATNISFFMSAPRVKTSRIVPQNPRVSISVMRLRTRETVLLALVALSAALAVTLSAQRAAPRFDVIIRNGRIVDGTGAPWFRGDVGLAGDRIAAIGNLSDFTA